MADITLNIQTNMAGATSQVRSFSTSLKTAASNVSKLGIAMSETASRVSAFSQALNNVTSQVSKFGTDALGEAVTQMRALSGALKDMVAQAQRMGSGAFSEATAQMNSFVQALKDIILQSSKTGSSIKSTSKSFSLLWKSASKSSNGVGKFVKSLGRIAFYRAIRTAIRAVTQALKEGLQNAYQFSKINSGPLAQSMDKLKRAAGIMTNQLGAAFGGLIVTLTPILTKIINLVTAAADAITRFFAVLNGQKTYKKAVNGINDVSSAAGGAGKKVKGLLADFDELTVIGSESGGGGGGSSNTDYGDLFEYEDAMSEWADLFNSGEFFKLGEKVNGALGTVSQKLTAFFNDVNEKDYGTQFGEFVNGIFSDPKAFEDAGEAVAAGLNLIVDEIKNFFLTFDATAMAESVTAFFNSFFKNTDWEAIGQTILLGVLDAIELVSSFILDLNWAQIFRSIFDAITGAIKTILENPETLLNILKNVVLGIVDILGGLIVAQVAGLFEAIGMKSLADKITSYWDNAMTTLKEKTEIAGDAINKSLKEPVENTATAASSLGGIFDGIRESAQGSASGIKEFSSRTKEASTAIKALPVKKTTKITGKWAGTSVKTLQSAGTAISKITSKDCLIEAKLAGEPVSKFKEMADAISDLPKKKTIEISTKVTISNTSDLQAAVKKAMKTSLKVEVSGGGSGKGTVTLTAKASGGYVDSGQVFLAREAGPELVGQIGGRTAVANNDQIVESVSNGVAAANAEQNALLRQQNGILKELLKKELIISPSASLGQVVARSNALYGRA